MTLPNPELMDNETLRLYAVALSKDFRIDKSNRDYMDLCDYQKFVRSVAKIRGIATGAIK